MSVIQMNNHQFNEAVFQGDKPVLVEFWAPWCVYCRRITPAMNKVAEQYGKNLTVAQINIDDEPMLANQEQICPSRWTKYRPHLDMPPLFHGQTPSAAH